MTVVRFNTETERAITACNCGRTVSLPTYGISKYQCLCGWLWIGTPENLQSYRPRAWPVGRKGDH